MQNVCSKKSSNVCVILFSDSAERGVSDLKGLIDTYKNDPLTFTYVNRELESQLYQQLGAAQFDIVAYRPKRRKYAGYKIK